MRSKAVCVSVLVRFVIFSVAVCGCTEVQTADLSKMAVSHENIPLKDIQVFDVDCRQDEEGMLVSGKVRRNCNFCYDDVRGHVDIVVLDEEGGILGSGSAFYNPRSIPTDGTRHSFFSTTLEMVPPEGTVIRTAYHELPDSPAGTKAFQCQGNRAALEAHPTVSCKRRDRSNKAVLINSNMSFQRMNGSFCGFVSRELHSELFSNSGNLKLLFGLKVGIVWFSWLSSLA